MTIVGKVIDLLEGEDEVGNREPNRTTLVLQGLSDGQPVKVCFDTSGIGFPSWQKGTAIVLEVEPEIVTTDSTSRIRFRPTTICWNGLTVLRKEVFNVSTWWDPFSWLPLDAPKHVDVFGLNG
jgi:hypothetical protein